MNVSLARHLLHAGVILSLLAIALYLPFRVFGVVPFTRTYQVGDTEIARLLNGLNLPDYYAEPTPEIPAAERPPPLQCTMTSWSFSSSRSSSLSGKEFSGMFWAPGMRPSSFPTSGTAACPPRRERTDGFSCRSTMAAAILRSAC